MGDKVKVLKNKNGFSLTELIAVLVILSLLITLGVAIFMNTRSSVLNKSYENLKTYLETKAVEYANETSITTISVEDLIKAGYVTPDDQTDIYNPINKESMNCYIIRSKFVDGEYVAELSENLERDSEGKCSGYTQTSDYQICRLDKAKNECLNIGENDWFNYDITLGIKKNTPDAKEEFSFIDAKYNWSNNMGFSSNEKNVTTNVSSVSSSVYKCEITFVDEDKNMNSTATKKIQIDKEPPVINEIIFDKNWSLNKIVEIIASDGTGSGIGGYQIVKNEETCGDDYKTNNKIEITTNGNYKVCVKDKAGNIAMKENIEITTIDDGEPSLSPKAPGEIFVGTNNDTKDYFEAPVYSASGGYMVCDPESTGTLKVGVHTLKCTAYGNNGKKAEATNTLTVLPRTPSTPKIVARYKNRDGAIYNGSWTNQSVYISMEPGSDIDLVTKYYYKMGKNGAWQSPSWLSMNGNIGSFTYEGEVSNTIYIKACYVDESGEECSGESSGQTINIDKTAPTCKLSVSTNITFANKSSDVTQYGISKNAYASYGTSSLRISTGTIYGYVLDRAGNTGSCSVSVTDTIYDEEPYTCETECGGSWEKGDCQLVCYYNASSSEISKKKCNSGAYQADYKTCYKCYYSSCPSQFPNIDWSASSCTDDVWVPKYCTDTCYETVITCSRGYTKLNRNYCYKIN